MGNDSVRLRDKIDTAIQDAEADKTPKAAFIEIWHDVEADYETMREAVHQYLSNLFDEKRVRATVASRIKTLDSISKSIDRRDNAKPKEQKYRSPRDIFDDLHDLVGFRVVVDYPSGLNKSYDLIEESFQVERFNSFSSSRTIGQHWKTRFGAYETRNYLLRLGPDANITIYTGVLLEIQVTTMAENLYNKLAHPLLYKASQGGLSRKDEMIIDMGHGAALLYWITVACMEERLEDTEEGDHGSRFPNSVRSLAGNEVTVTSLDAVVDATPDIPSTSQDSTSIDFLLKALADIRLSNASEDNIWETIKDKLGFDQHQLLSSLPTVPEARFDSQDLEESPKCHKSTRQEVRQAIKNWVNDDKAELFFWLHAPAGVGKSTLARTLVHDLRPLQLAAGYFFRRGHELRNDTSRVLTTIASQLTRTIPCFANALRQSIEKLDIGSIDKVSLREQFETLIYKPLGLIKHMPYSMLIIVDALDECTKQSNIQTILELLARLQDLETFRMCVFFSSRNTRALNNAFERFKANATCREMALHEQSLVATRQEMETVLRDGLEKIKKQRNIGQDSWPSEDDFDTILRYATTPSPLFIYTSTFLRHINCRNPNKRFQRWLETSRHGVSQLDHIYDPIMESILAGEGDDEVQEPLDQDETLSLQLILGSLALVTIPMTASALQRLLGMDDNIFKTTLESLHAVVHVPEDDSPIYMIHKSFADYILGTKDEARNTFTVDFPRVHDQLAKRCIDRMGQGLRKNICNTDNPLIESLDFDKDIVRKCISPDLAYACTHWVHHLEKSQKGLDLARKFLQKHFLHWLETLSILGRRLLQRSALEEGGVAIRTLLTLAQKHPIAEVFSGADVVKEAQLFLQAHVLMINNHPLQIYGVCLAREHASSRVGRLFSQSQATRLASVESIRGGVPVLPPGVYEIATFCFGCLAISPDGQKLATNCGLTIEVADTMAGLAFDRIRGLAIDSDPPEPYELSIIAMAFSQDQLHIIGLTNDTKIFEWDTQLKTDLICRGSLKAVSEPFESGDVNVEFSMSVATKGTAVYAWNFQHGFDSVIEISSLTEECHVVDGEIENGITDVSLSAKSPTDWTIAMVNKLGTVFVWSASQMARGRGMARGKFSNIELMEEDPRVAISPCGSLIALSNCGKVYLWRWYKNKCFHVYTIPRPEYLLPRHLKFFPNGKALAVQQLGRPLVIPIPERSTKRRGNAWKVQTKKVSRNCQIVSQTLFDASTILQTQGTMSNWRQLLTRFYSYPKFAQIPRPSKVISMKLASNKRVLVTESQTHVVLVWDIDTGYLQHEIHEGQFSYQTHGVRNNRAISSDGRMLAVGGLVHVNIWNLQTTPATLRDLSLGPFRLSQGMEFTLDSRSLAICDIGSLSRWNVITAERQWIYEDPSLNGISLKISSDELTIVTISSSRCYLIDAMTGCCRMKLDWPSFDLHGFSFIEGVAIGDISFSDTGRFVLFYFPRTYTTDRVLAWDLESNNICLADSAIRNESRYIASFMMKGLKRRINYRGQDVFLIEGKEIYAASGNRMVLAQEDGEFTVIDFDDDRIGEI